MDKITISGHSDDIICVEGKLGGKAYVNEFYKEYVEIDTLTSSGEVVRNLVQVTFDGVWRIVFVKDLDSLTVESHTKPTKQEIEDDTCYTEKLTLSGNILAIRAWAYGPPTHEEIVAYLQDNIENLNAKAACEVFYLVEALINK